MKFTLTKALLFLALAAAILSTPIDIRAQAIATHLSALEIDLWPEYDRPTILIIYKMALASDVSLPASMEVRIPADAQVNAVAALQVNALVNMMYQERSEANWKVISFTATVPEVQVEFYDPGLVKDQNARHYEFTWPGWYTVDNFVLKIQQPLEATDMQITPDVGNWQVATDGLTYYLAEVGPLDPNQLFQVTMDYNKPSDTLTAESMQVQPAQPLDESSSGATTTTNSTSPLTIGLIVAGVAGLTMIIGGAAWYFITSRKDSTPSQRRRQVAAPVRETSSTGDDAAIYCKHCGKRAASGDRFCRQCGARLKVD